MTAIKRALISVSDKKGIVKFASALNDAGIEIISTGGTFSELKNANIDIKDVSSVTNFPEILDGRVKTLHPKIHGGLLNIRSNKDHQKTISEQEIKNIDLLIIGINVKSFIHKLDITGNFEKGYYEHINWVAKFSNAYPKIKVVLNSR